MDQAQHMRKKAFTSVSASDHYFCLLITLADSLDPDMAQQNIRHGLDPKC